MTRTDIFSGFLGAGKTTLIRKLISEGYKNEKIVIKEKQTGKLPQTDEHLKELFGDKLTIE